MQDRMRVFDEEQAMEELKKKSRRISGEMVVEASEAEEIMTAINTKLGSWGFGCEVGHVDTDHEGKTSVSLSIVCDASPGYFNELARRGFNELVKLTIEDVDPCVLIDVVDEGL